MLDIDEIRTDIAAFADSEDDVIIDKGSVIFSRDRQTVECELIESPGNVVEVQINDRKMPYLDFIGEELGRMSVLAEAIKQKRQDVNFYVDTQATLTDSTGSRTDQSSGLELLRAQCEKRSPGTTKLIFLTADAGDGKTALLRRLTRRVAEDFSGGNCPWLLLHVDTQGRSFVRLEEAVAMDLGQLRISGLFYSGIIRLVRHGLLTIAVDGFDELLAEIGSGEAYSGLGAFLKQLDGRGIVIAAARSAYFEAENYAAQSRLLSSLPNTSVEVEQMGLQRWRRQETVKLFSDFRHENGQRIEEPEDTYDSLATVLGEEHVILHSPFLVHRLAIMLAGKLITPTEISQEIGESGLSVVPNVIRSFLDREVGDKWRDTNGNPYLTREQHVLLLSMIADEMWQQSTNRLSIEMVQLVAETLLDEWNLPQKNRIQVIERIKAHALLQTAISIGYRSFEHEEFFNYFLAERLSALLQDSAQEGFLRAFLGKHSLPKIVAKWVSMDQDPKEIHIFLRYLNSLARSEVRSGYLKQNIGLIVARAASACPPLKRAKIEAMYFEGDEWKESQLKEVTFERCTFLNAVLSGSRWIDCRFLACDFNGLSYNVRTSLKGSEFDTNCRILGVLKVEEDSDHFRTYVPEKCRTIIGSLGGRFTAEQRDHVDAVVPVNDDLRGCLETFLRIFSRNTGASDQVIDLKLGRRRPLFRKSVLPPLLEHELIRKTQYRGSGHQDRFELVYPVEEILMAEDPEAPVSRSLVEFWDELRSVQ